MKALLPAHVLAEVARFLAARLGLHFPPDRWPDLQRSLEGAANDFGMADPAEFAQWLVNSPLTREQVEILADNLTVGETYFLRDGRAFELLQHEVLPPVLRERRGKDQRLRIWSAACCTGEEPYSIAMVLRQMLPDWKDWNITLLATDINPHFLRKAAKGVYGEWSFRGTPDWIKTQYFRKLPDGRHEIHPEIRSMVTFNYLNLAEDAYPSLSNSTNAMDIIFCRNVLIYFAPEPAGNVVMGFHRSLVEGGWLFVSPSEFAHVQESQFVPVTFTGAVLYRKDENRTIKDRYSIDTTSQPWAKVQWQPPPVVVPEPLVPFQASSLPEAPAPRIEAPVPAREASPYERALELHQRGRYQQAEEILESLTGEQALPQVFCLQTRVLADQGKLAAARAACEKAISADKLNPVHHFLLATILQEEGALDQAGASLRRSLYLDPRFVLAHYVLGNLCKGQGREEEARKHFSNALELLRGRQANEELPQSDGITAGRLAAIIESTLPERLVRS